MKQKRLFVFILTILLTGLYASFMTADLLTGNSENIYSRCVKSVCILICLFLALIPGKEGHDRGDTVVLQIAMILTAVGDFFLGIREIFEPPVGKWESSGRGSSIPSR